MQVGDGPFVEIRLGGFAGAAAAKQCHEGAEGAGLGPGVSDSSEGGVETAPAAFEGAEGGEASAVLQLSPGGGGGAGAPSVAVEQSGTSAVRPSWMDPVAGIFEVRNPTSVRHCLHNESMSETAACSLDTKLRDLHPCIRSD